MMAVWKSWYRGNVNDFHYYNAKLANGKTIKKERRTLNMAKKICEDFSKLEWSEKVEILLDNNENTNKLWKILESRENDFSNNFPILLEKMYALGTMVTVEYKQKNKTVIDYIDGDVILPFKYTNSYISGLISVSRTVEGPSSRRRYYTLLTYHEYDEGCYLKTSELYVSSNENTLGKQIDVKEKYPNLLEDEIIETEYPRFQVWKIPIANNFDTDSPMGLSVFANHIDKLKSIDIKYDSFNHEFASGRRRILVDKSAVKGSVSGVDENNNPIMVYYFDSEDDVYVAMSGMDNQPVKDINFDLRVDEHISAINSELNYLSAGVGLGNNFYNFDGTGVKTATEVVSENSDTYRTKSHHQNSIRNALIDLVGAICELEGIPFNEISINFDDSIIQDTDAIRKEALTEYNAGLISKAEYFRLTDNLDDETALKFVEQMNEEIQTETISDGSEFDLRE